MAYISGDTFCGVMPNRPIFALSDRSGNAAQPKQARTLLTDRHRRKHGRPIRGQETLQD